jgi:hypothetical protein
MAKRKKSESTLPAKVRLELRFDEDVYERIKTVAEKASISVNQLLQGLARWAGPNLFVGEPERDADGLWKVKETAGCVFVGRLGTHYTKDEVRVMEEEADQYGGEVRKFDSGEVYVALDFTERRVITDCGVTSGTQRKASGVQGRQ